MQASLFYYTFLLLSSHTLLNLFVAVILEQFAAVRRIEINPLKPDAFAQTWREFDPETLMRIPFVSLEPFMVRLGPPLGFPPGMRRASRKRVLLQLKIPSQGQMLSYVDVLEVLSKAALRLDEHPPFRFLIDVASLYKVARDDSKWGFRSKSRKPVVKRVWHWIGRCVHVRRKRKAKEFWEDFSREYAALLIQQWWDSRSCGGHTVVSKQSNEKMLQRMLFQDEFLSTAQHEQLFTKLQAVYWQKMLVIKALQEKNKALERRAKIVDLHGPPNTVETANNESDDWKTAACAQCHAQRCLYL